MTINHLNSGLIAEMERGYGFYRNPFVKMARSKRFELLTPRFVVWCSIQLSYERV